MGNNKGFKEPSRPESMHIYGIEGDMRDPYQVLGLNRGASDAEVKSAYRRLAKKYHPDKDPGDLATLDKFRAVCEAYDVIRQESSPAETDRWSPNSMEGERWGFDSSNHPRGRAKGDASKNGMVDDHPEGEKPADSDDLFSDWISGIKSAGKRAFGRLGEDSSYELRISFEEAATGTKKRIKLSGGRRLDVKIPGGVEDGQQIRLKGQGSEGENGGQPSDAVINITVKPHDYFKRHGSNVHLELPVTISEVVLGAKIKIPSVDGTVALSLRPGSNADAVFRLRGKGSVIRGKRDKSGKVMRGDQYVSLKIFLPDKSDQNFEKSIKRWAAKNSFDVRDKFYSSFSPNKKSK